MKKSNLLLIAFCIIFISFIGQPFAKQSCLVTNAYSLTPSLLIEQNAMQLQALIGRLRNESTDEYMRIEQMLDNASQHMPLIGKESRFTDPGAFYVKMKEKDIQAITEGCNRGIACCLKGVTLVESRTSIPNDFSLFFLHNLSYFLWMKYQFAKSYDEIFEARCTPNSPTDFQILEQCFSLARTTLAQGKVNAKNAGRWFDANTFILHTYLWVYQHRFYYYGADNTVCASISLIVSRYYTLTKTAENIGHRASYQPCFWNFVDILALANSPEKDKKTLLKTIFRGKIFFLSTQGGFSLFEQLALVLGDRMPEHRMTVLEKNLALYKKCQRDITDQIAIVPQETRDNYIQVLNMLELAFTQYPEIDFTQDHEEKGRQLLLRFYQLFHKQLYSASPAAEELFEHIKTMRSLEEDEAYTAMDVKLALRYCLSMFYAYSYSLAIEKKDTHVAQHNLAAARMYYERALQSGEGAGAAMASLYFSTNFFFGKKDLMAPILDQFSPTHHTLEHVTYQTLKNHGDVALCYRIPEHFHPKISDLTGDDKEAFIHDQEELLKKAIDPASLAKEYEHMYRGVVEQIKTSLRNREAAARTSHPGLMKQYDTTNPGILVYAMAEEQRQEVIALCDQALSQVTAWENTCAQLLQDHASDAQKVTRLEQYRSSFLWEKEKLRAYVLWVRSEFVRTQEEMDSHVLAMHQCLKALRDFFVTNCLNQEILPAWVEAEEQVLSALFSYYTYLYTRYGEQGEVKEGMDAIADYYLYLHSLRVQLTPSSVCPRGYRFGHLYTWLSTQEQTFEQVQGRYGIDQFDASKIILCPPNGPSVFEQCSRMLRHVPQEKRVPLLQQHARALQEKALYEAPYAQDLLSFYILFHYVLYADAASYSQELSDVVRRLESFVENTSDHLAYAKVQACYILTAYYGYKNQPDKTDTYFFKALGTCHGAASWMRLNQHISHFVNEGQLPNHTHFYTGENAQLVYEMQQYKHFLEHHFFSYAVPLPSGIPFLTKSDLSPFFWFCAHAEKATAWLDQLNKRMSQQLVPALLKTTSQTVYKDFLLLCLLMNENYCSFPVQNEVESQLADLFLSTLKTFERKNIIRDQDSLYSIMTNYHNWIYGYAFTLLAKQQYTKANYVIGELYQAQKTLLETQLKRSFDFTALHSSEQLLRIKQSIQCMDAGILSFWIQLTRLLHDPALFYQDRFKQYASLQRLALELTQLKNASPQETPSLREEKQQREQAVTQIETYAARLPFYFQDVQALRLIPFPHAQPSFSESLHLLSSVNAFSTPFSFIPLIADIVTQEYDAEGLRQSTAAVRQAIIDITQNESTTREDVLQCLNFAVLFKETLLHNFQQEKLEELFPRLTAVFAYAASDPRHGQEQDIHIVDTLLVQLDECIWDQFAHTPAQPEASYRDIRNQWYQALFACAFKPDTPLPTSRALFTFLLSRPAVFECIQQRCTPSSLPTIQTPAQWEAFLSVVAQFQPYLGAEWYAYLEDMSHDIEKTSPLYLPLETILNPWYLKRNDPSQLISLWPENFDWKKAHPHNPKHVPFFHFIEWIKENEAGSKTWRMVLSQQIANLIYQKKWPDVKNALSIFYTLFVYFHLSGQWDLSALYRDEATQLLLQAAALEGKPFFQIPPISSITLSLANNFYEGGEYAHAKQLYTLLQTQGKLSPDQIMELALTQIFIRVLEVFRDPCMFYHAQQRKNALETIAQDLTHMDRKPTPTSALAIALTRLSYCISHMAQAPLLGQQFPAEILFSPQLYANEPFLCNILATIGYGLQMLFSDSFSATQQATQKNRALFIQHLVTFIHGNKSASEKEAGFLFFLDSLIYYAIQEEAFAFLPLIKAKEPWIRQIEEYTDLLRKDSSSWTKKYLELPYHQRIFLDTERFLLYLSVLYYSGFFAIEPQADFPQRLSASLILEGALRHRLKIFFKSFMGLPNESLQLATFSFMEELLFQLDLHNEKKEKTALELYYKNFYGLVLSCAFETGVDLPTAQAIIRFVTSRKIFAKKDFSQIWPDQARQELLASSEALAALPSPSEEDLLDLDKLTSLFQITSEFSMEIPADMRERLCTLYQSLHASGRHQAFMRSIESLCGQDRIGTLIQKEYTRTLTPLSETNTMLNFLEQEEVQAQKAYNRVRAHVAQQYREDIIRMNEQQGKAEDSLASGNINAAHNAMENIPLSCRNFSAVTTVNAQIGQLSFCEEQIRQQGPYLVEAFIHAQFPQEDTLPRYLQKALAKLRRKTEELRIRYETILQAQTQRYQHMTTIEEGRRDQSIHLLTLQEEWTASAQAFPFSQELRQQATHIQHALKELDRVVNDCATTLDLLQEARSPNDKEILFSEVCTSITKIITLHCLDTRISSLIERAISFLEWPSQAQLLFDTLQKGKTFISDADLRLWNTLSIQQLTLANECRKKQWWDKGIALCQSLLPEKEDYLVAPQKYMESTNRLRDTECKNAIQEYQAIVAPQKKKEETVDRKDCLEKKGQKKKPGVKQSHAPKEKAPSLAEQQAQCKAYVQETIQRKAGALALFTYGQKTAVWIDTLSRMASARANVDTWRQSHWRQYEKEYPTRKESRMQYRHRQIQKNKATEDFFIVLSQFYECTAQGRMIEPQFVKGEQYRIAPQHKENELLECSLEVVETKDAEVTFQIHPLFTRDALQKQAYQTQLETISFQSGTIERIPELPIHQQAAFLKEMREKLKAFLPDDLQGLPLEGLRAYTPGGYLNIFPPSVEHPIVDKVIGLVRGTYKASPIPEIPLYNPLLKDNTKQYHALSMALEGITKRTFGAGVIRGVFGSGKSTVNTEIIMQLSRSLPPHEIILVLAPSHAAVDVLVKKVIEQDMNNEIPWIRMAAEPEKVAKSLEDDHPQIAAIIRKSCEKASSDPLGALEWVKKPMKKKNHALVLFATSSGYSNTPLWRELGKITQKGKRPIRVIIADEQSMSSSVEILRALYEILPTGFALLSGDPGQLGPHAPTEDAVARLIEDLIKIGLCSQENAMALFSPEHIFLYEKSLLEELVWGRKDIPFAMLPMVLRFPAALAEALNFAFISLYEGNIQGRKDPEDFYLTHPFSLQMYDYTVAENTPLEQQPPDKKGWYNDYEIGRQLDDLDYFYSLNAKPQEIRFLCAYKAQLHLLPKAITIKSLLNELEYGEMTIQEIQKTPALAALLKEGLREGRLLETIILDAKGDIPALIFTLRNAMRWDMHNHYGLKSDQIIRFRDFREMLLKRCQENSLGKIVEEQAAVFRDGEEFRDLEDQKQQQNLEDQQQGELSYKKPEKKAFFSLSTVHTSQGTDAPYVSIALVRANPDADKGFYSTKHGPNIFVVEATRAQKIIRITGHLTTFSTRNPKIQPSEINEVLQARYEADTIIVDILSRLRIWGMLFRQADGSFLDAVQQRIWQMLFPGQPIVHKPLTYRHVLVDQEGKEIANPAPLLPESLFLWMKQHKSLALAT